MNRFSKFFMAVSRGQVRKTVEFKRYTGVAECNVLAVNPTQEELEKLGFNVQNPPVYVRDMTAGTDNHNVKVATVTFVVRTADSVLDSEGKPLNLLQRVSFNIRNEFRGNSDKTKVQVIDKYGRTAWVTKEQYAAKQIPMYSNGPAALDPDYRACYSGEENLTNFVKIFLNIKNVEKWEEIDGKRQRNGLIDNPEEAEMRFDCIKDWFNGDFSEVKEVVNYQPENTIKLLFGIRTTEDNKKYQTVYTDMFLHPSVRNYQRLLNDVTDRQNAGAYPNTVFTVAPLAEYKETATDFSQSASTEAPASFNPFSSVETAQSAADSVFGSASADDDLPFGM